MDGVESAVSIVAVPAGLAVLDHVVEGEAGVIDAAQSAAHLRREVF